MPAQTPAADVIAMKECKGYDCPYRSRADYPYSRRAADGSAINGGFAGDGVGTADNFAKLTDTDYAYTVEVPEAEKHIKKPEWLNDPIYYHNRGNSTFSGESSSMGDFVGLDDLMTENPAVIQGFIDVGFSKFVLIPTIEPADWDVELAEVAQLVKPSKASLSFHATRRPLPPPPALALIMTG